MSIINRCKILEFPKICHPNGTIAVAENSGALPFAIKRTFYIYDIPSDTERGAHAHKIGEQIIIAAAGSFEVSISDGRETKTIILNRPYKGLYVPPGVWVGLKGFSSGCVCLAFCSNTYDESDYIRDYQDFLTFSSHNNE